MKKILLSLLLFAGCSVQAGEAHSVQAGEAHSVQAGKAHQDITRIDGIAFYSSPIQTSANPTHLEDDPFASDDNLEEDSMAYDSDRTVTDYDSSSESDSDDNSIDFLKTVRDLATIVVVESDKAKNGKDIPFLTAAKILSGGIKTPKVKKSKKVNSDSSKASTTELNEPHISDSDLELISPNEKMHTCDQCDYQNSQRKLLRLHKKSHTNGKSFTCDQCDYKTGNKSILTRHMRTHTGEKPFACEQCNFKSATKNNLTIHMRTHTGEKPFACEQCDYKAARQEHLIRHIRIHTGETPFACEQCDYKASRKDDLTEHAKIHTGEKPFACEQCDYKTGYKSNLTRHMRIHTQTPENN